MAKNMKFCSSVLVFEDSLACNAKLSEELHEYSYEIIVLGLDCEWVSQAGQNGGPPSPVALLQLAFPNGTCFLIRLCKMEAKLPEKLRDILEDRNVLKTGVGINEDVKKLNSCYGLVMQGCVDLRHVALRCRGYVEHCFTDGRTREGMSLSALSQQILGVTMDKDWKIRCSDWEAPQLTERQIEYAANDAIIAIQIFFKLVASKLKERENRIEAGCAKDPNISTPSMILAESSSKAEHLESNELSGADQSEQSRENSESMLLDCLKVDNADDCSQFRSSGSVDDPESEESMAVPNNEQGVLSNLVSKIRSSFGTVFETQAQPKDGKNSPNSKHKTKHYAQYQSFKTLELNKTLVSSAEFWSCVTPLCHGIIDMPYKIKSKHKGGAKTSSGEKGKESDGATMQGSQKKSGLKPRRAPLYQNCVLEAPDGEMLSTCDKRKAEWYLCRDLAKVVKEEPYTIRLNFEPSGRPFDPENNYYLTFKENICVVCGRDDSYMRKNVIPHDYRKHFPVCMKDHHSHDVLLLCPPCHMISTYHDDSLRRKLAAKYQSPLASAQVARLVQDPELKKVKCAAKALVYAGEKIPEARKNELLCTVKEFLKTDSPTREMLLQASELETRRENCDFFSHGREVVRRVKEEGELLAFERMWREHFLETMKPKYLPPLWTVDHEQEKVRKLLEKELNLEES